MAPVAPAPVEVEEPTSDTFTDVDVPWIVIVWNDPINLMSYVAWVFQKLFGYSKEKADQADARRPPQGQGGGVERAP